MQNLAEAHLKYNNDFLRAEKYLLESIDIFKAISDKRGSVYASHNYARVLLDKGDSIKARNYYRESLRYATMLNETSILLFVMSGLTRLFCEFADYEKSAELCGFLLDHPEFDNANMENISQVVEFLHSKISQTEYNQAFERGKSMEANDFIDTL
jgi:tetratricopeptide (TPR) repeat protein